MGGFLMLVAVVVVIVLVVKKSNEKTKALEELENCNGYHLAIQIKEELEKRGIKFGELSKGYSDDAYGEFRSDVINHDKHLNISFSRSRFGLKANKIGFLLTKAREGNRICGIENENVSILVSLESYHEFFQGVPELLQIAAEVINNNGFGKCSVITEDSRL